MYIMNSLNKSSWFTWLLIYGFSVAGWHGLTYSFYGQASYRIGGAVLLVALIYLTQKTFSLLRLGMMLCGIFVANYLIENALLGMPPLVSAISSTTLIFQACLGWVLLQRFTPDAMFPDTLNKSLKFLLFAITLPVLASSMMQLLLERAVSSLLFDAVVPEFLYWTALRFTALVLIAPLLLWLHDHPRLFFRGSLSPFIWILLTGIVLAATVFSLANPAGRTLATYSFLLIPFILFTAIRLPLAQSLLVLLCVSLISFWADSRTAGQTQQILNSLTVVSVFISFNAMIVWLIGVMLHEREQLLTQEVSLRHLYEMLSRFNQLLIKQPLEKLQLFESACRIILEETMFDQVSILYLGNSTSDEKVLNCTMARESGDFITIETCIDEHNELVQRVLTSQKHELLTTGSLSLPDRYQELKPFANGAVAAFPIKQATHSVGCLLVFSKTEYRFNAESFRLLQELADDTGFAITMHATQKRLQQTTEIFDHSVESIMITDEKGTILDVNPAFSRISGYGREEILGQNSRMLKADIKDSTTDKNLFHQLLNQGVWSGEVWHKRKNGELYLQRGSLHCVLDSEYKIRHIISIMEDITQRRQDKATIRNLANYDQLTGLPNRILLAEQFLQASTEMHHAGMPWSLLFIDLDKFKEINDAFGHQYGDELLKQVTERLRMHLREPDLLSRFGGDEFIILIQGNSRDAGQIAQLLIQDIKLAFLMDMLDVHIGASIGIATYPQDGNNLEELIQAADTAMNKAKALGGNQSVFFNMSMQQDVQEQVTMRSNLDKAIRNNELSLYLQPKVTFIQGTLQRVGYEALIRWPQQDGSMISPEHFIPAAEKSGLIVDIDLWVLKNTIEKLSSWKMLSTYCVLPIAVNVSASLFAKPEFVSILKQTINASGLQPELLELEITERVAMLDVEYTLNTLNTLKGMGIGLSLDDFGTGYSNLAYLRLYPLDVLKIDISFIRDVHLDEKKQKLVRAIINMAQALGMKSIAEGVECQEELDFLLNEHCDQYQGFFFAKPEPAEKFIHLEREITCETSSDDINKINIA
jgi:diguanylate cyclase (GGDEF)-like protein/PAS domain S-box-containing protein